MLNDLNKEAIDLLEKSNSLFIQKKLEQAHLLAKEGLQLSMDAKYVDGSIKANVLLGNIENVLSKYRGNEEAPLQALTYAQNAQALLADSSNDNGVEINVFLLLGESHLNCKDYAKAELSFNKALELSKLKEDFNAHIISLTAKCRLAIAQNKFKEGLQNVEACLQMLSEKPDAVKTYSKAEVYYELCKIYVKRQEHNSLLDASEKLLDLSQKLGDIEKEISALSNLGIFYAVKAKYKKAMQYFLDALEKSKKINYRTVTSNCLINIATIYAQLYNFNDALDRYQTVLEEYSDVISENNKVIVCNNLGNIYFSTERITQAEEQFNRALQLAKDCNYREMVAHSYAQLSKTAALLGDFEKAHANADLAEELIVELGEINGKQINLINRGSIHFHQKDYNNAMKLISKGVVLSKRMKDEVSEIRGYQLLAKVYKELGMFEQALKYQMIYSKVQEDFNKEIRNRQIIDLEIKYAIKEKEQEIEQLVKENKLQALLLQQSDQISKQNTKLLQVNDELRQFAYVVSHDLKEPLRMIGSYTQLIHRLHHEVFTKDSETYFEFVKEGVERMNDLLDGLLKYATIGKDEMEAVTVDLSEAAELAAINLNLILKEKNAVVNIAKLPLVKTIRPLWTQIFQNLISNAIKFHREGVQPIVDISYEQTATEIIISVKDNGIGIEKEYKDRIFVIFQRLHNRSKYEGTGIGLAICQKIMQRLNGRIWFQSEVGKGTTFFCAIPNL